MASRPDWPDRTEWLNGLFDLSRKSNDNQPLRNNIAWLVIKADSEGNDLPLAEMPELGEFDSIEEARAVLRAGLELRRQLRAEAHPITKKQPFPGLRHMPDGMTASMFLREQYQDAIDDGRLTPGELKKLDLPLYASVCAEARALQQTVSEYLGLPTQEEEYGKRKLACSTLLGTTPEIASAFLAPVVTRDYRETVGRRQRAEPVR